MGPVIGVLIAFFFGIWVIGDAQKRGTPGFFALCWGIGVWLLWIVFFPLWILFRPALPDPLRTRQERLIAVGEAALASGHNSVDELEKLARLRDRGVVTDEEFSLKKQQLLGV